MKSVQAVLARVELALGSTLMVIMVALVFWAALSRYVAVPINWSVDAAQGIFVWIVFLGASQALRRGRHIGVGVFVELFPKGFQLSVRLVLDIVTAVFLAAVIVFAIQVSIINVNRNFPSFAVSYSWVTSAVAGGGALMLITVSTEIWATIKRLRGKD